MTPAELKDILLYQSEDGKIRLDVQLDRETVWLNQKQLSELFDVNVPAISKHVRNIIASGELDDEAIFTGEAFHGTNWPKRPVRLRKWEKIQKMLFGQRGSRLGRGARRTVGDNDRA